MIGKNESDRMAESRKLAEALVRREVPASATSAAEAGEAADREAAASNELPTIGADHLWGHERWLKLADAPACPEDHNVPASECEVCREELAGV